MRITGKFPKRHYLRRVIIFCLACCILFNTSPSAVLAGPEGAQVVNGQVSFQQSGYNTTITASDQSIINYSRFDIARPEVVQFIQPSSNASVLNRILSAEPTMIEGTLLANGRVFFVNPAGVMIGDSARINVNQLVASGLNISNSGFLNGQYEFVGGNGVVVNNGDISAESVYLVGKQVANAGNIECPKGYVVMAAGDRVFLGEPGSKVIVEIGSLEPTEQTNSQLPDAFAEVTNEGTVEAAGGTIILAAAGDAFSKAIMRNIGILSASATGGDGGNISLEADNGQIDNNGSITAKSDSGIGGTVTANAGEVVNTGTVDVSGAQGGTAILKGTNHISQLGTIKANGTAGDGGFVEISGDRFILSGDVDVSATNGEGGKLLIDPADITIADGYIPPDPVENTVYEKWIEEQSQTGADLDLDSYGSIFVEHISDGEITGGSGDIALRTVYNTGGITYMPQTSGDLITTTTRTTNGGNIYMLAGAGGITVGDVITETPSDDKTTEPGKIRLFTNNGGDIETGSLMVDGGSEVEVSVISSGNLSVGGDVKTETNRVPANDPLAQEVGQAKVCLVADENVNIDGAVEVHAHGKNFTTADIHICAGKDVTVNLSPSEQIEALANTTETGAANASILIHAGWNKAGAGVISINGGGSKPVHVKANAGGGGGAAEVFLSDDPSEWDEINGEAHAKLEVEENHTGGCPDCPKPPDLPTPIPPIAEPDWNTTHMGDAVNGNVLDNDTHPDPMVELAVESYTQPSHGTVMIDEDGFYTYQPDAGYVGEDSFTYIATDGQLSTEPIEVIITLTNELPLADGGDATGHMGNPINGSAGFHDVADGGITDPVSVANYTQPGHGTVVMNPDGTFTYQPTDSGYVGPDSFEYSVTDAQGVVGTGGTGMVNIELTNITPLADGGDATGHMGNPINGSAGFHDVADGGITDPVSVANYTQPGHGTVVMNPDGTFTYQPTDSGYVGPDSFEYSVTDAQGVVGTGGTGTVTIIITNTLPVVTNESIQTQINQPVNGSIQDNISDPDGDPLTVANYTQAGHGTVVMKPNGTFTYTPSAGFAGQDSFIYFASDGQIGAYTQGTVTITVEGEITPTLPLIEEEASATTAPATPQIEDIGQIESMQIDDLQWLAEELGLCEGDQQGEDESRCQEITQAYLAGAFLQSSDMQPYQAAGRLRGLAEILHDPDGSRVAALGRVVAEFAQSPAPPSEEQMASIVEAFAAHSNDGTHYAAAGQWLDALSEYVGILNSNIGWAQDVSIAFVMGKYGTAITEAGDVSVIAFVQMHLEGIGG